jgi:hypothetical protein
MVCTCCGIIGADHATELEGASSGRKSDRSALELWAPRRGTGDRVLGAL